VAILAAQSHLPKPKADPCIFCHSFFDRAALQRDFAASRKPGAASISSATLAAFRARRFS